jgi:hypothetical protein
MTMQAQSIFSAQTLAALDIPPDKEVHPARDADQLGIDLLGPEHDDVDTSDFEEVSHG